MKLPIPFVPSRFLLFYSQLMNHYVILEKLISSSGEPDLLPRSCFFRLLLLLLFFIRPVFRFCNKKKEK